MPLVLIAHIGRLKMTVDLNEILQGFRDKREEARQLFIKINEDDKLSEDIKTEMSDILEKLMDGMTLILLDYKLIQCKQEKANEHETERMGQTEEKG